MSLLQQCALYLLLALLMTEPASLIVYLVNLKAVGMVNALLKGDVSLRMAVLPLSLTHF